jgi:ribosome-binding protein aMBF1 (putative translation factor)
MKTETQRRRKTQDAVRIMEGMIGKDSRTRKIAEEARINVAVAQLIYEAREKAGMTQKELAELIGTRQPVIARLEDADYRGHSLSMLQRIANALHRRIEIRLLPASERRAA